jgi:hypothetical protein
MVLNNPPDDVQTKARSSTRVPAAEALEKALAALLRHAVAIVFHGDRDPVSRVAPRDDVTTARCCIQCIRKKVDDRAPDLMRIT